MSRTSRYSPTPAPRSFNSSMERSARYMYSLRSASVRFAVGHQFRQARVDLARAAGAKSANARMNPMAKRSAASGQPYHRLDALGVAGVL